MASNGFSRSGEHPVFSLNHFEGLANNRLVERLHPASFSFRVRPFRVICAFLMRHEHSMSWTNTASVLLRLNGVFVKEWKETVDGKGVS